MYRIIKINILVVLALFLFIELSGQLLSMIKNNKFLFDNPDLDMRSELFEPHPNLSVALKKNVNIYADNSLEYKAVKTTEIGTRWTGADLNDTSKIRIVCLGGSTTFCTGVDDHETWPAILQQYLGDNYAVINYGVPAYKTTEAIVQMALYVPELKPDIVVFYQGINDMYNYYQEPNYPDYFYHSEFLMPNALLGIPLNESGLDQFKRQSGFFYIANNIRELFEKPIEVKRYEVPDVKVDSMFTRNMKTLIALTKNLDAKPYIISQVLNPHLVQEETPWSIRLTQDKILPMMTRLNELGEQVCLTDSSCTYLDFEKDIKWMNEHFWDDMHFTKKGSEVFARKLADKIRKNPN